MHRTLCLIVIGACVVLLAPTAAATPSYYVCPEVDLTREPTPAVTVLSDSPCHDTAGIDSSVMDLLVG